MSCPLRVTDASAARQEGLGRNAVENSARATTETDSVLRVNRMVSKGITPANQRKLGRDGRMCVEYLYT